MWLSIKEFIKDSIIWILIFLGMFIFVIYILTFTQVVGPSMEPILKNKDVVVVQKLFRRYKRGDIVTHRAGTDQIFIKRIIAIEDDKVIIEDGKVYINDQELKEDYVLDENNTKILNREFEIVPKDHYLVLGDNRDNSKDSRDLSIGFIKKDDITGKVFFKFFPFNKIGIVK